MKEATGELNMTLVVVISIGVLATFFFTVLWPQLRYNFESQTNCNKATCDCSSKVRADNNGKCYCKLKGNKEGFTCVYKG